jgi:tRNA(Ile2) C34 agmatinyltransferase TiaS
MIEALLFFALSHRSFHKVEINQISTTSYTHVEVQATVKRVYHERDGDTHLILTDGTTELTAECIPELPSIQRVCDQLSPGDQVTVDGITRFDKKHHWPEIHPVLGINPLK